MLKELQADYKKCVDVKGLAKDLDSPPIKFFRYDTIQALEWLEEEVLKYKVETSDDPIKASKIEDYADNKDVANALKAVKVSLKGWKDCLPGNSGAPDPDKSPQWGKINYKKLQDIKDKIEKHKKELPKSDKLDQGIVKLEKQIDADLKEIEACRAALKKIPKDWYEPDKLYEARTKYILKAKPRLSSKQKKYNELAPKLTKRALQEVKKECDKLLKDMNKNCDLAVEESTKKNTNKAIANWQAATKQLQALEKQVSVYTKIGEKYKKEISKSEGKKVITDYIDRLKKLEKVGKDQFEKALEKINKLAAESKKEEKGKKT